jgi:hypothetical protein
LQAKFKRCSAANFPSGHINKQGAESANQNQTATASQAVGKKSKKLPIMVPAEPADPISRQMGAECLTA